MRLYKVIVSYANGMDKKYVVSEEVAKRIIEQYKKRNATSIEVVTDTEIFWLDMKPISSNVIGIQVAPEP